MRVYDRPPDMEVDYYLAGSIGVVIGATGLIALPVHLAGYRERGVMRRFQASSIPTWAVLGAQVIVTSVMAGLGTVIMLLVGFLGYGANAPEAPAAVALGFVLGILGFMALGFVLGGLLPTARAAQGVGLALFFVMMFVSGSAPPLSVLPDYMVRFAEALPLTYVVASLQDPWVAYGGEVAAWNGVALIVEAGVLVVASGLAVRFFRWN